MSQNDFTLANADGATFRADANSALQALASLSAGTSAPSTMFAGQFWLDTTNHLLKRRNEANNAWITVAKFDETNGLTSPYAWNAVIDDAFETLASATTTNLATPVSRNVSITGTTTITGLGTVKAGSIRHLRFEGALTFTHNGTSLILPGAANITTAANDTATMISLGSGNWLCLNYKKADGTAVVAPAAGTTTTIGTAQALNTTNGVTFGSLPAGIKRITIMFYAVSLDDTDDLLIQIGDSGGLHTTGYVSGARKDGSASNSTAGFVIGVGDSVAICTGHMTLTKASDHLWVSSHQMALSTGGNSSVGGGYVTLDTALTQLAILDTGGDAFDGGTINIVYEV